MRSERPLESRLSEAVAALKTIDGLVGIILFGSVARGEADEGSDVDLLVLFEDEDRMRRSEWEVTRRMPRDLFAQSICVCPSTLKEANPVFIQSALEEGTILYMQHPLALRAELMNATPAVIIVYSLQNLSQREKQRVNYRLFGRKVGERCYPGLLEEHGGQRLGRGCVLVPEEDAEPVLKVLSHSGVKYEIVRAYTPGKPQPNLAWGLWPSKRPSRRVVHAWTSRGPYPGGASRL